MVIFMSVYAEDRIEKGLDGIPTDLDFDIIDPCRFTSSLEFRYVDNF